METTRYVSPALETLEMSLEAILCASADSAIDFSTLGSEGIENSGYTINWGA